MSIETCQHCARWIISFNQSGVSRWIHLNRDADLFCTPEPNVPGIEKCKNCGNKIVRDEGHPTLWMHQVNGQPHCNDGEPGMGLIETIREYYREAPLYASWAHEPGVYTHNAILHGLRMQATIHWNNCSNAGCKNCVSVGKSTADSYMRELANGRHDLHPNDDSEVHSLAFKIHNAEVEAGTHQRGGKPGIMTCTYVVGAGSSNACNCYALAYARWILIKAQEREQSIIAATPFDLEDMHYEPRYE